ncbi:MAG: ABC transporter ATP-binding protein [Bifidobacteriaceae bacterium]|jgi:iron complex transport system ATP-binding protein|nr:ABC transporter ATP-binding protein [Bifidobacteriaceae bacterium]
MTQVLRFEGVSLRRGRAAILQSIFWNVYEGENWVVLGPNGAGKTTLLQIAAARMHPSSGQAWVLGERLGRVDVFSLRPRIGLASAALAERIPATETAFNAVMTGAYAVTGRWREAYEHQDVARAHDLLAAFGVESFADRRFGTLSEGERKRVQIARALMADPEMLLLDEPSAGLDLGGRETLVGALGELARDRRAPVMILVTHHAEEIPPGFSHAALMRDGRITASGPIDAVIDDIPLSQAFGLPLSVTHRSGRWAATAV